MTSSYSRDSPAKRRATYASLGGTKVDVDVAFVRRERSPPADWERYAPLLPDLAVEMISPSQTVKKAQERVEAYLRHGTAMVWLVRLVEESAEKWTAAGACTGQCGTIGVDGALTRDAALSGFSVP